MSGRGIILGPADEERVYELLVGVAAELRRAARKFGPFASGHEGYAVIREELDELWDDVRADRLGSAVKEAQQVAAMAVRFMLDLGRRADPLADQLAAAASTRAELRVEDKLARAFAEKGQAAEGIDGSTGEQG